MKCKSCGFVNPEGSKFCGKCGVRQQVRCSSCGQPVKIGLTFCTNCGQPLTPEEIEETKLLMREEQNREQLAGEKPRVSPYLVKQDGTKLEIKEDKILIGRQEKCDIVLPALAVSARHARLERTGDVYSLTDLRSTNGTYVNNRPISTIILHDGDRVKIGAENFIFQYKPEQVEPLPEEPVKERGEEIEATIIREMPEIQESAAPGSEEPAAEPEPVVSPAAAAGSEQGLTGEQVQTLARKMEKGLPSPFLKSPALSVVLFSDETLTWAGKCSSLWYFGPSQNREIYVGVTQLRFIIYYVAEVGRDECQSYWYDVDFGGKTWQSSFKTWRAFTIAPPELKKKKIELSPRKIRDDGEVKTLFVAMPLEDLEVKEMEGVKAKYREDPEAFFSILQRSYENRRPTNPAALLTLLEEPKKAPKIPGTL